MLTHGQYSYIIHEKCVVMIAIAIVSQSRFVLKSAPLHKSYTCSFCKSTIKAMQKLVKCSCKLFCAPYTYTCIVHITG